VAGASAKPVACDPSILSSPFFMPAGSQVDGEQVINRAGPFRGILAAQGLVAGSLAGGYGMPVEKDARVGTAFKLSALAGAKTFCLAVFA
jgi:hypothetical protein